ncbi:MAG: acyltransferase [Candidatus Niyogibacteria bacterium]|nr:acyltransferase [Candidatus Niyogibacteria bacterium]
MTKWLWVVWHVNRLKLGKMTDIGVFTYINAEYGVTIEDEVEIGSHCSVFSVSTIDGKKGPIMLKKGCKIGSHTIIMPGVTIGKNTIVGAHSFVNRNLPDNVVAFGVPAKVVRGL